MPLRHILLWAGPCSSILTPNAIDSEGEEAWVLVRLFYLDRIEICTRAMVSLEQRV
jgi:hypothetical protein